MGHYKSNLRDLEFNLFELFALDKTLESGQFGDLDVDTVRDMLSEVRRLAEGPLAESFADADRNPPTFDPETHTVTLPESFKKSYRALQEAGWDHLGLDEELGGMPVPRQVFWAVAEMILGSNPAAFMYSAGPGFAQILSDNGNEQQKKWAVLASERNWGATMVLTEPDAGSDVGAGRTKAVEQADGSWHIEGVKRFITSADSDDLFENIFHLVLARPEGAKPGTKGLSLFFVPKFHFDSETGELGERNGVFVTNVEHKMGLKVSATCELTLGGHGVPAKGWLVGDVHNGIAQMFDVIEHARMMVGTKAISTLSTGYLTALDYAKQRIQGADLTQMTDKAAPRVSITHHPDVRRSLMTQKAYAEGLRAVFLYTAAHQDEVAALHVSGADKDTAFRVNDLLLPIVKGVGSEVAYEQLAQSLQTLGGSGFLQDYPIEQYIRDAKIDSLYEGTTAIQAQDFFFRKIARDRGVALAHVAGQIKTWIDSEAGNGRLKSERALLNTALEDVQGMVATLTQHLMGAQEQPTELYKVGLGSVRLLMSVGDLMIGWLLLRQSEIAIAALDNGAGEKDKAFYEGKIGAASFFAKNILPRLTSTRQILSDLDNDVMELDEAAF
ncbi:MULTISPECIES: acyl-CoA dehydrogenase [unclassified Rhodococcus (in: high G+C Gram-positive bacteria)]|jgi:alkylation response protein AidB-like acyl-CoA dehydrogenase|uniref:acyl-CoA dehydrogenase n=1 Tax=unclassified Rhodococcus (in: high G+C Gram-positive bacteria) TaxID=192944 RepID=UPI00047F17C2|nr:MULTISPECIES: acyl-CoA dehydrogenase [unclassified Rhodococcus (in: high G+C Gram-positive bacteria)]KQU36116.1 butyryl-CoA dehydrogenase [Rhodococcus sp. Leaf225]KQU48664.1 butyryl-CoA dehydrogenase [Rhodococcus sp. Leaf258]MBY6707178.1 acyl-CoA dehydrogenase [Rhodococcus sp. BP-241]MDQ1182826.1 alkylation response protein AidB-like acyl-CoA dehydrogenase [Rhodococcus sp. SORGH_AS_0301]